MSSNTRLRFPRLHSKWPDGRGKRTETHVYSFKTKNATIRICVRLRLKMTRFPSSYVFSVLLL